MIIASLTIDFGFQIDSGRNVTLCPQQVSRGKLFVLVSKKYFLYRSFRSETDFCLWQGRILSETGRYQGWVSFCTISSAISSCSKVRLSKDISQSYNLRIPSQHDVWI